MTIDEAIKDLEYGTEQLEMEIKSGLWIKGSESELRCKEGIALNKQHIEWLTELKEAKRLLKAAVEDIHKTYHHRDESCDICKNKQTCTINCAFVWQHKAEALKLIGEEGVNNA